MNDQDDSSSVAKSNGRAAKLRTEGSGFTRASDAERRAFAAGWNARETGSGHRADGLESCLGMFVRGFNFGDADTGEDITRRPSAEAELLAALQALTAILGNPDGIDPDAVRPTYEAALKAIAKATGSPTPLGEELGATGIDRNGPAGADSKWREAAPSDAPSFDGKGGS